MYSRFPFSLTGAHGHGYRELIVVEKE